jgi:acetylornithine deacetylase/succinyl-diaminopimelate desuccinylase-like protein
MGEALRRFAAHPGDADAARVIAADPGRVGQLRTTCVATMLEGGHAENALPQSATATVNCRIFPGTSAHAVEDTLRQLVGPGVEVALSYEPLEADASPMRADVMAAVTRAVGQYFPGAAVGGTMAAYATDGAVFRRAGIPTYGVSGLFEKPSDFFAHGLNERIPVASFYADLGYWYTLIRDLAGGR